LSRRDREAARAIAALGGDCGSRDAVDAPPGRWCRALASCEQRPGVYRDWFRRFIATRSEPAAERCLRTAIAIGSTPQQVADMVFAACTDHVFLGVGHALDFANKAFELLDRIGWQHAEDLLSSLVPVLARAQRMEETASWRHPVDLPRLLDETDLQLDAALAAVAEGPLPAAAMSRLETLWANGFG